MAVLNYTTGIDFHKTIGEITKVLVAHGARDILTKYSGAGMPEALVFSIPMNDTVLSFSLPARSEGVLRAMEKAKAPKKLLTKDQAMRVAWRIIKDWVEAQMALVEAEIAETSEVFFPYALLKTGKTVYEEMKNKKTEFLIEK